MPSPDLVERAVGRLGGRTGTVRVWRAPGRVNIIGEHIDYVGGSVLPFACDTELVLAAIPHPDEVVLTSVDEPGEARVRLDAADQATGWGRFAGGVVTALRAAGYDVAGIEGVVASRIPVGAGLSSSAALQAAIALALTGGRSPAPEVLQDAERWASGVPCGLMDPTAVLYGRAGHALLVDCRTATWEQVPLPASAGWVVLDTGTRRRLADGRYAERREEAEAAVDAGLGALGAAELREIEPEDVAPLAATMDDTRFRRLWHVVTEVARVEAAVEAIDEDDLPRLGELLNASHESLRTDVDVSAPPLDAACEALRSHSGCYGARLVGAGFAGCVVGIVDPDAIDDVCRRSESILHDDYPDARAYVIAPVDGANEVSGSF